MCSCHIPHHRACWQDQKQELFLIVLQCHWKVWSELHRTTLILGNSTNAHAPGFPKPLAQKSTRETCWAQSKCIRTTKLRTDTEAVLLLLHWPYAAAATRQQLSIPLCSPTLWLNLSSCHPLCLQWQWTCLRVWGHCWGPCTLPCYHMQVAKLPPGPMLPSQTAPTRMIRITTPNQPSFSHQLETQDRSDA